MVKSTFSSYQSALQICAFIPTHDLQKAMGEEFMLSDVFPTKFYMKRQECSRTDHRPRQGFYFFQIKERLCMKLHEMSVTLV